MINIRKWFKSHKAMLVLSQKILILDKLETNVLNSALIQIYDINKSAIKHFMREITCLNIVRAFRIIYNPLGQASSNLFFFI